MAHLLDFQTGAPAFISYKTPAWHGLGVTIDTELSVADALKFAHLDFRVEKAPNHHQMPTQFFAEDGSPIMKTVISNNSFFTYRTDTNHVLGDKLGKNYEVLQNEEALLVVDNLVKEGGFKVETAGAIRDGAVVFMCLRLPNDLKISGDIVKQYLILMCGHDGSTPILAYFSDVRVVCNNTLQMSMRDATQKHSIRHTKNAKGRLEEALTLMGIGTKNEVAAKTVFNKMAQTKINEGKFWSYLANVFLKPKQLESIAKGDNLEKVIGMRLMHQMDGVLKYSTEGPGQQGDKTYWWAYNAITGYFCNAVNYDTPEERLDSLLWNRASDRMEKALTLASDPAVIYGVEFHLN